MNKEVSFPIAKLLKEKGLEQNLEVGTICRIQNAVNKSYEKIRPIKQSDLENQLSIFNEVYPTISDVVMWFYDKHRIWIWVGCRELEDGTNKTIFIPQGRTIPSTKKDGFVVDIIPYTPKGSPTEAYEAGIEYALNKLI